MKHIRPIVSRESLETVRNVFPQLGPVVFGELFGTCGGPFCFPAIDAKGGIESVDKGGEELGFHTTEAHPLSVGAGIDAVKGCAAVEGVRSAWFGEVRGAVVGMEKGKGGDIASSRNLSYDGDEKRESAK